MAECGGRLARADARPACVGVGVPLPLLGCASAIREYITVLCQLVTSRDSQKSHWTMGVNDYN